MIKIRVRVDILVYIMNMTSLDHLPRSLTGMRREIKVWNTAPPHNKRMGTKSQIPLF